MGSQYKKEELVFVIKLNLNSMQKIRSALGRRTDEEIIITIRKKFIFVIIEDTEDYITLEEFHRIIKKALPNKYTRKLGKIHLDKLFCEFNVKCLKSNTYTKTVNLKRKT